MAELKHAGMPIRILLGGGIGSGKSIAGRRLEQLGVTVIDADRLGHAVLEIGGEAFAGVADRWPSVLNAHGIDRVALGEVVFADAQELARLEAMTHPPIMRRISEAAAGADDLVVEVPLILGIPGEWVRVFVAAEEDVRLRRAVERGASESAVEARMASQPTCEEWLAWSDQRIDNDGSIEVLEERVDALWYGLRSTDHGPQP